METWEDRYRLYGAGDIIKGSAANIATSERNTNSLHRGLKELKNAKQGSSISRQETRTASEFAEDERTTGYEIGKKAALQNEQDGKFTHDGFPKTSKTHERVYNLFYTYKSSLIRYNSEVKCEQLQKEK